MRFKAVVLSLLILVCPCALCYGQLSFSGVNGERGYSAMRAVFRWDSDAGIILTPSYEYYRMDDDPDVEKTGTAQRYGLRGAYELTDDWQIFAGTYWRPPSVGDRGVQYFTGIRWAPFYKSTLFSNPQVSLQVGQGRYKVWVDSLHRGLPDPFKEVETNMAVQGSIDVGHWNLKGAWQKVLKYSTPQREDVSFSWADVPFMTAVIQGFIRDAAALRISYQTPIVSPYATYVRYQYGAADDPSAAVNAGLFLRWGETVISGGVEVFEPRQENNRRTFFSMSVEVPFL